MNSTKVQNPQRKLDVFGSVLAYAKPAHVFQNLSYSLCRLCLSFVTNNSSSDSKAFLHFNVFSGAPTVVHRAFLFRLRCEGMATTTNWRLHVHYSITLWAYLSQMHRPNLWYYTVGIASEPLVKDSHNRLSSTEKPQYCLLQLTWLHFTVTYVLQRGIRKHCTWREWLT